MSTADAMVNTEMAATLVLQVELRDTVDSIAVRLATKTP